MHAIRRNVDLKIILFNNQIYGLTKGQYSPTSPLGKKTKSTPYGSVDNPLSPLCVAIGSEATFVARSVDVDIKHLTMVLERAAHHKGTAFVEVYQDCNVFNSGVFAYASKKDEKDDNVIYLEHGKPLIFGKNRDKGIRVNGAGQPEIVNARRSQGRRPAVPRRKGRRALASPSCWPHALSRIPRTDGRLPRRSAAHLRRRSRPAAQAIQAIRGKATSTTSSTAATPGKSSRRRRVDRPGAPVSRHHARRDEFVLRSVTAVVRRPPSPGPLARAQLIQRPRFILHRQRNAVRADRNRAVPCDQEQAGQSLVAGFIIAAPESMRRMADRNVGVDVREERKGNCPPSCSSAWRLAYGVASLTATT